MFDVDWTDYNSERVGQRRARKEIERDLKKKDDSHSAHDSVITRSSSSSDRHFGILESIGLKKISASPKMKKPATLALRSIKDDDKRQRNSICAPSSSKIVVHDCYVASNEEVSPKSAPPVSEHFAQNRLQIPWKSTKDGLQYDFLSPKPLDIAAPASTPHHSGVVADATTPLAAKVIQSLGSDSYITKTTEMIYEPRTEKDAVTTIAGISIVAERQIPQSPTLASSPASPASPASQVSVGRDMSVSLLIDKWFTAVHSSHNSPSSTFGGSIAGNTSPSGTPSRSPRNKFIALTPPSRCKRMCPGDPHSWKPPDAWNCVTPDKPISAARHLRRVVQSPAATSNVSLDLDAMKHEIKKMAVACPQSILVKLNEEWGATADANFYRRLEMERKRWMLSALNSMHEKDQSQGEVENISQDDQKVLALFESQSTTAYLAAFYAEAIITHLSPSPLSHVLFPNVQPLFSTITPILPLAANLYTSIHCLTLPSMMASQDIPLLLGSIHRCLAPKGVLHLNLIDPVPNAKSLGPRTREWFEQNLMFNLEKKFRCMNPCRLLPEWLGEAHLRGQGSRVKKVKFQAVYATDGAASDELAVKGEGETFEGQESPTNAKNRSSRSELMTTVGRLLWQEVWGKFVHGNNWWWQDPDCVEECLSLGTYWEYWMIDSVKEEAV